MLKLLLYAAAAVGVGAIGLYSSHRITQTRSEKEKERQKRALFDSAIRREDFVQFRELLQRFIRLDPRDDHGNTPFMLACQHGNLEVIRYYLSMHPPSSDIQKSPLFLAANDNGHTAVHVAALSGSVETMRALLGSNSLLALAMVSIPSIGRRSTPLHIAVENGLFNMVEALIKLRADVNAIDIDGITPIMLAIKFGKIVLVERLLNANANINLLDSWKHSALFYACKHQEYDMAKLLLEKKKAAAAPSPKLTPRKTRPPLSRSPSNSSAPAATSPVGISVDIVNVADRFGYTALLLVAEMGDLRMFDLLLEYGAARGVTALHEAASMHRLDLLQLFHSHHSSTPTTFSLIDNHGRTPLHAACIYNRPPYDPSGIKTPPTISKDEEILDLTRAIVEWGNPTNTLDSNSETPVDLARKHGLDSVVAFLLVHNAGKGEDQGASRSSVPGISQKASLSNLRIPLEVRIGALHGNVSVEGVAAVLEEGAWRVKNNFDRGNPFSVVVVVGPRAASSVSLKEGNALMGVEPLRQETLLKNPKEFFRTLKR
ncbi:hypothetical protein HDU67_002353 [Dinochytrium kinnereticum]|nr:hypothetical protein HDU67_002353 [Dinochytrium kinnereticum]